ncbi:MAG: Uma2 family endonuclease [Caldilineaceae bacterium]
MTELSLLADEEQEFDDMGSYNHSLVQGNLAYLLRKYSDYSAFIELSLDASSLHRSQFPQLKNELIPDVCVYPRRSVIDVDILVVQDLPALIIEVVSPRQGLLSIVEKFQIYFALGIQSCWLVEPLTAIVRIYHPNQPPKTFASGEVVDAVAGVKIPLVEIFS